MDEPLGELEGGLVSDPGCAVLAVRDQVARRVSVRAPAQFWLMAACSFRTRIREDGSGTCDFFYVMADGSLFRVAISVEYRWACCSYPVQMF